MQHKNTKQQKRTLLKKKEIKMKRGREKSYKPSFFLYPFFNSRKVAYSQESLFQNHFYSFLLLLLLFCPSYDVHVFSSDFCLNRKRMERIRLPIQPLLFSWFVQFNLSCFFLSRKEGLYSLAEKEKEQDDDNGNRRRSSKTFLAPISFLDSLVLQRSQLQLEGERKDFST